MTDTNPLHHHHPHHHPAPRPESSREDPEDPDSKVEVASAAEWATTMATQGNATTLTSGDPEERPPSFWKMFQDNRLYVLTYCFVFGSFGVCVGFLGPTVFDLGCQTHSDQKEMNWVFFVQLLMTLVGSISAGCMADK